MKRSLFVLMGIVVGLMLLRRRLFRYLLRLSPVQTPFTVQHDIEIAMPDGTALVSDHYAPRLDAPAPTILIRSPYGRNGKQSLFGLLLTFCAGRFAERGYHVIVQDVRGRFDSGGDFVPYFNESGDGKATLAWIKRQPWSDGQVGMWGGSYLGIVQWAAAPNEMGVAAIVPAITGSHPRDIVFPDDALDLGLILRWIALFRLLDRDAHRRRKSPFVLQQTERMVMQGLMTLPIGEADCETIGEPVAFFRDWLYRIESGDAPWAEIDARMNPLEVEAPAHLIGGWYDFFLRALLNDYATLQGNGKQPYLTIGPWHHFGEIFSLIDVREGLIWFDAHMKDDDRRLRSKPVRLYVMGAAEWREYNHWPPMATETRHFLQPGGVLEPAPCPADLACDHFRYDPSDPTPARGGTVFGPGGPRDNRPLEARSDVLVYTSAPLEHDVEVIGYVRLELYVHSNLAHTDFFGRLCDVHPRGKSTNICDGLFRLSPGKGENCGDGTTRIEIDMWATAHRFKRGHRIRLCIASGAHPHWTRNLGSDAPLSRATDTYIAEQDIYHDRHHPSALILPVVGQISHA